jgi:hypothetical protein
VSKPRASSQDEISVEGEQHESRSAIGAPRLLPAVTFGLSVAVLAGMVGVTGLTATATPTAAGSSVMTTAALGGAIGGLMHNFDTSCCPPGGM